MEIIMIRHGKTRASEDRLYCGWTDLPLSPAGRGEILSLKSEGIYGAAESFCTSGSRRATETLALIYGAVPATALPAFKEYNFGRFEMQDYETLRHDPDYLDWIEDGTGTRPCPGGESRKAFQGRVRTGFSSLLKTLVEKRIQRAALVCHSGPIVEIMEAIRPGERNFYEWQPACGRGYALQFNGNRFMRYRKIQEFLRGEG